MQCGDVVTVNGIPATVRSVEGGVVALDWFERGTMRHHRGQVSRAMAGNVLSASEASAAVAAYWRTEG